MRSTKLRNNSQDIINYYKSLESRLGYTYLTWNAKHFGYYPTNNPRIGEKKAQELMQDILAKELHITKDDLILDAGCGRGIVATYLAVKYEAHIIGIDIVAFEIEIAKRHAERIKSKGSVTFELQDYSCTTFPNNHFDAIYTMETLVHSPNLLQTLKELFRILKPGGRLILFEYSRSYPKDFTVWEEKVLGLINKGSVMTSLNIMFHDKWVGYIKEAGFIHIKEKDITEHVIPSFFRFYNYAKYPYKIIKALNIQKYFINTTAGVEFYLMGKKGLVKYKVLSAIKSK